jgi:hypothetical protein
VSMAAQIVCMMQMVTGNVTLGGTLSIFTIKMGGNASEDDDHSAQNLALLRRRPWHRCWATPGYPVFSRLWWNR